MNYPQSTIQDRLRDTLRQQLAAARNQTDRLFQMIMPAALLERPIPERHRIIFYLGHLEAFDWNMICSQSFGASSFNSEFDRLFAFGIDPVDGRLPDDSAGDWPRPEVIRSYNERARCSVDELLNRASFIDSAEPFVENGLIFRMAIEHRLMHAETMAYMLHWLPYDLKHGSASRPVNDPPRSAPYQIDIPRGPATLGQKRGDPFLFGWDNEFDIHTVIVPEFSIDALNVTNGQFLNFVKSGGYEERPLWEESSWQWIKASDVRHPKFWIPRAGEWFYRTMFDEIPLPLSWPVYVSYAEAQAYCRWVHKSLPTEEQYQRAAFASPDGSERPRWGGIGAGAQRGNFDFRSWSPEPVGVSADGRSPFGVFDLVGNGWEWTSTPFAPFTGFEPFPFYPGYSADFFDGRHFVLKGASPRTSALLVRPSFRNWFQPFYPNAYTTFRCVEN